MRRMAMVARRLRPVANRLFHVKALLICFLLIGLAFIPAATATAREECHLTDTGESGYALGALRSSPEVLESASRDYANHLLALAATAPLPLNVDLSGQLPPIGNQGYQGSCTAWATAYYYKTFQERAEHGWDVSTANHQFSPSYVYNQIHANDPLCGGTSIAEALDLIIAQGVAPLSIFPYSSAAYNNQDCWTQPSEYQRRAAQPFRAQSRQLLFFNYPDYTTDYNRVTTLKAHLALGDILVLSYPICDYSHVVDAPCESSGGHAIAIVGYDDTNGYFKFVNSWGPYWGDGGYGYMSYSFVATYAWEAWAMTDRLGDVIPTPMPFGMDVTSVRDDPWPIGVSRALSLTSDLNFGYVQVYWKWALIEPAAGLYDWSALDDIVQQCDYYGLTPVLRIYRAPSWARAPGSSATAPPAVPQYLHDFMFALVSRYGTRFAGYVIWNEPNTSAEWGGQAPNATSYVQLLQSANTGAKLANPAVKIVSAGLAPTNGGDGAVSDLLFLQQMYNSGLESTSDVIGMNGLGFSYPPDDTSDPGGLNFSRLASLRNIMVANDDSDKRAWALEVGWLRDTDIDLGSYNWMKVSAENQGNYLKRALLKASSEWPWLELAFVWNLDFNRYYSTSDQKYWFGVDGTQAYSRLLELQTPTPPTSPTPTATPTPSPTATGTPTPTSTATPTPSPTPTPTGSPTPTPTPTPSGGASTERVSIATDGTLGNSHSGDPSISADGRYVAFLSYASNLVPSDTNGLYDIFVRDRTAGTTERVSVATDGTEGNHHSVRPSISAGGRYVAFDSHASNWVPTDTNGASDIFVRDRLTGALDLISVASDGAQGNGSSVLPSISADSRYVAFYSHASNLVHSDTNGTIDIFVRDRVAGTTERVSVASGDTQANGDCDYPAISADGRYVAFQSSASNLAPSDTNGTDDVFVHDRVLSTTERVSVATGGAQGTGNSWHPWVSGDGRYVAFASYASNLVAGDSNGVADIFVSDRLSGTTERISVSTGGAQGNDASYFPRISANGRHVAYTSYASNLIANDTNGVLDAFVRDRVAGTTERVSVASDGTQADRQNDYNYSSISADGRYVAFQSEARNWPGGTDSYGDVYVRDLGARGTIAGRVDLQGRANDAGAIVAIGVHTTIPDASGAFMLTDVAAGTYTATASMPGYVFAQRTGVVVSEDMTTTLPPVTLLGGDATGDGDIDIYDLTLLGTSFGGGAGSGADINGDGVVNVFDLVLVGANFGRSAPLPW